MGFQFVRPNLFQVSGQKIKLQIWEENLSEHPGWQLGSQCSREWSPGFKKIKSVKQNEIGIYIGTNYNSRELSVHRKPT